MPATIFACFSGGVVHIALSHHEQMAFLAEILWHLCSSSFFLWWRLICVSGRCQFLFELSRLRCQFRWSSSITVQAEPATSYSKLMWTHRSHYQLSACLSLSKWYIGWLYFRRLYHVPASLHVSSGHLPNGLKYHISLPIWFITRLHILYIVSLFRGNYIVCISCQ